MRRSNLVATRLSALLAAPVVGLVAACFATATMAQGNASPSTAVTRAQARAELAELVGAGYNPNDRNHYPDNLWAAQQRVAQQHAGQALAAGTETSPKESTMQTPSAQQSAGGMPTTKSMSDDGTQTGVLRPWARPKDDVSCGHRPECNVYYGR